MKHTTAYEDDASAGIRCDGEDTSLVLDAHLDEGPQPCPRCGMLLRLIWDVRIEEVSETPPNPFANIKPQIIKP